jgi:hypothetical protein
MSNFTRRSLFKATAGLAGAAALSKVSPAFGQSVPDKTTLVMIHLDGGYNALFGSADSFLGAGTFGTTTNTVKMLGNGLAVDAPTFGTMPTIALNSMASVGVDHGLTAHESAQTSMWTTNGRSYALMLANALGGDAPIKAANVGSNMIYGPHPAEGTVSLQSITDMRATIVALGGDVGDPSVPKRTIATAALGNANVMSTSRLLRSPNNLRSVGDGYVTGVDALKKNALTLDYNELTSAYGVSNTTTGVTNFQTQMVAAELMVLAGANVVAMLDGGWDTHGDTDGMTVRNAMNGRILPPLNTFLSRMLALPGHNVVVSIIGDFSRSLPGSDHQGNLTATVIGKNVRQGTTGRVDSNVGLPGGSPGINEYWAYLAAVCQCPSQPFGANPHTSII